MARVGLGCMGMSEFYGPVDDLESLRALRAAFELGYRHFDSSDFYGAGHNERLLGRFLQELGASREQVVVATKCGLQRRPGPTPTVEVDSSPTRVRRACEASLTRLGVERIDILYLHRRSPLVPIEDTIMAMATLVQQGKVGAIGLSEVSEATLRAAVAIHPVCALQSEYSLWTRDVERGMLRACAELGVNLVAYSPLGRGFLAGRLEPQTFDSTDDLRKHLPRFAPANFQANQPLLAIVRGIAEQCAATPAQVVLAWLLAQSPCVHVIPGARKASHLSDNFGALRLALNDVQLGTLERAFAPANVHGARYPESLMHTLNT